MDSGRNSNLSSKKHGIPLKIGAAIRCISLGNQMIIETDSPHPAVHSIDEFVFGVFDLGEVEDFFRSSGLDVRRESSGLAYMPSATSIDGDESCSTNASASYG